MLKIGRSQRSERLAVILAGGADLSHWGVVFRTGAFFVGLAVFLKKAPSARNQVGSPSLGVGEASATGLWRLVELVATIAPGRRCKDRS